MLKIRKKSNVRKKGPRKKWNSVDGFFSSSLQLTFLLVLWSVPYGKKNGLSSMDSTSGKRNKLKKGMVRSERRLQANDKTGAEF